MGLAYSQDFGGKRPSGQVEVDTMVILRVEIECPLPANDFSKK